MIEDILLKTYSIVLPLVLGYIIRLLHKQKEDRKANSKGTMLLLRSQLIADHDKYTNRGSIPTWAYENFNEMYDAYHALGGNGMVTKMSEEIHELHLQTRKDERM